MSMATGVAVSAPRGAVLGRVSCANAEGTKIAVRSNPTIQEQHTFGMAMGALSLFTRDNTNGLLLHNPRAVT